MLGKLSFYFRSKLKEHNTNILNVLAIIVGALFVTIFSGLGYTTFEMGHKPKAILYILALGYFFVLFIFNLRITTIVRAIKLRKIPLPSLHALVYLFLVLWTALSFAFNPDKTSNLNAYFSFLITISSVFFISRSVAPLKILKIFKTVIFFIALLSIVVFAFTLAAHQFFPSSYFSNERIIFGNHFFISTDFVSGLTYSMFFRIRLSGPFWEPSVFGIMLIAALICDFFTKDRLSVVRNLIFLIAIILTQSTSAYILYVIYLLMVVANLFKKSPKKQIVFSLSCIVALLLLIIFSSQIIAFLAKVLPSVFGKFTDASSIISVSTRLYSLRFYFELFLRKPFFGYGAVSASAAYYQIVSGMANSETSTFGLAMASLGIGGIVFMLAIFAGIILNKKISTPNKIFLCLIVLLMSNAQGQAGIIGLILLYFLPLSSLDPSPFRLKKNLKFHPVGEREKTVRDLIFSKNDTGQLSSNLLFSMVIKGISIVLAFFTIPIYLRYFNDNQSTYGVWLAITSILSVITVFDFGMGNGLKNQLIKNIAENNDELSKKYISTTYVLTAIIGGSIFAIASILIFGLPDSALLNAFFSGQSAESINLLSFRIGFSIVVLSIGTQFCLKNINYVLQAHQRNAITGVFMLTTNICMLAFASIFSGIVPENNKIIVLTIAYFVFLNAPLLFANLRLFNGAYRNLSPSFTAVDFKNSKNVISTGAKFFIVQIGTLFMWSANEFIILFAFSNSAFVTEYSEYYRLFSLLPTILGTVIQQPLWTAISKADIKGSFKKTKQYYILLAVIVGLFIIANIGLVAMIGTVFDLWLGSNAPAVTASRQLTFLVYSVVYLLTMGLVIVCNALSLFKSQIASAIMAIAIKIPLIILLSRTLGTGLTWELIIWVNMACYLPVLIFAPLEIALSIKKKFATHQYKHMGRVIELSEYEI